MTQYHELTAPLATVALETLSQKAIVWRDMSILTNQMRLYDASGELHIFQTEPAQVWTKQGQGEIAYSLIGKAFTCMSNEFAQTLANVFQLTNAYWSQYDFSAGWASAIKYCYDVDDATTGPRYDVNVWVTDVVPPGGGAPVPTMQGCQMNKVYSELGHFYVEITTILGGAGSTELSGLDGAIKVEVINQITVDTDVSGIVDELGLIKNETIKLNGNLDSVEEIGVAIGVGNLAGSLTKATGDATASLNLLQPAVSAINGYFQSSNLQDIANAILQCHQDLDGIEAHTSHFGNLVQSTNLISTNLTNIYNILNNHLDQIRLACVNIENALTVIGFQLVYDDGSGVKGIAQVLAESGGGSTGGGLTKEEWQEIFNNTFLVDIGGGVKYNVSQMLMSLLNTGWMVYL